MPLMHTRRPTCAVMGIILATAIATAVIWSVEPIFGTGFSKGIEAAILTILVFVVGYCTPLMQLMHRAR